MAARKTTKKKPAKRAARKKPVKRGKVGHPRKEFDLDLVRNLGKLSCTYAEMAAVLDCSRRTIASRMKDDEAFIEAYNSGAGVAKMCIRRTMLEKALGGNVTKLIFLAKNWLGFRDNPPDEPTKQDLPELREVVLPTGEIVYIKQGDDVDFSRLVIKEAANVEAAESIPS